MRILLADDSVTAQNMGKKILAEAGHEITTVSNGAAAMKKISETRPDLIILDIYMPGYTGLEVCQRVKESRDIARTPVLLTVGKLEPFKKEDARRVRAEAVVVKPFEASELLAAVNKIAEYVVARPAQAKKGSLRERAERAQSAGDQWDGAEASGAAPAPADISEPAPPVQEVVAIQSQPSPETLDASPATDNELSGGAFAEEMVQLQPISSAQTSSAKPAMAGTSFEVHAEAQSVQQQASRPAQAPLARAATESAGGESPIESPFPDISGGDRRSDLRPEFSVQAPEAPVAREPLPVIPTSFMPAEAEHPAADPAFIADRNQALTSFPTHFGISQAEVPAPAEVAASAAQDEVESALASLPGESPGLGAAAGNAWIAEELPIEAGEEAVSLEQEMSQAHAALEADAAAAGFEPAPDAMPEFQITPELPIAVGNNGHDNLEHDFSESFAPGSQRISIADADLPHFAGIEAELPAILPAEPIESTPAPPEAASIPEMSAADMAALERVVARLLDQLKPKIVAEIAREIAAGKK